MQYFFLLFLKLQTFVQRFDAWFDGRIESTAFYRLELFSNFFFVG